MQLPLSTEGMDDARTLRDVLVDELKQWETFKSQRVEVAFRKVPRHLFLPDFPLEQVYKNQSITTKRINEQPISSSSQPSVMAAMLEMLDVQPGQRILEIGAGTGYNAALLADLVGPAGQITTVDLDQDIVDSARTHLAAAGFSHVQIICNDGWLGYRANAPYDHIVVTAGVEDIAPAWWDQLVEGGRLVVPLGLLPPHLQPAFPFSALIAFDKTVDHLTSSAVENCSFIPLRGTAARPLPTLVPLTQEIMLALSNDRQGDRDAIAQVVEAQAMDEVTNVRVMPGELAGLGFWVGLCDFNACLLTASGQWYGAGMLTTLWSSGGETKTTIGSASANGVGILLGQQNQADPNDKTLRVVARSFGSDATITPRLLDHIHAWDRAGRPFKYASFYNLEPGATTIQIRAYPPQINYKPTINELSVRKAWAHLVVDFGS